MMNIGEFAVLTGLSVKALRHYDDRGVLSPAAVDTFTGYRKYSEDQVRSGVIFKTLRDAGVSVTDAAAATTQPADGSAATTQPMDALEAHRTAVLAKRQEEDRAHGRALAIVRALAQPMTVSERRMSAQPFVGVVLTAPSAATSPEEDDRLNDEVTRATEDLWLRLASDGLQPSGPLCITMRMQDRETIELACCLPVPHRLPDGWGGEDVEVGELPERTELCAVWKPQGSGDIPEGVTHPAVVGLLDAYAEHPTTTAFRDAREIRQIARGTSADDWTVEISVTVG